MFLIFQFQHRQLAGIEDRSDLFFLFLVFFITLLQLQDILKRNFNGKYRLRAIPEREILAVV